MNGLRQMNPPSTARGWNEVEAAYGQGSVALLPDRPGRRQRVTSIIDKEFWVEWNPNRERAIRGIPPGEDHSLRLWISPDGSGFYAWPSCAATHHQLFIGLEKQGWVAASFSFDLVDRLDIDDRSILHLHGGSNFLADACARSPVFTALAGGGFVIHTDMGTLVVEDPIPTDDMPGKTMETATSPIRVEAFHGTNQAFEAFDAECLGLNNDNLASAQGFFFAGRADTAWEYAEQAARKLVPGARAHEERIARLLAEAERAERRGDWALQEAKVLEAEKAEADAIQAPPAGARVLRCEIVLENPLHLNSADVPIAVFSGTIAAARDAGHDGVVISDHLDTPGCLTAPDTHYAVFDPARIRILEVHLEPSGTPKPSIETMLEPGTTLTRDIDPA